MTSLSKTFAIQKHLCGHSVLRKCSKRAEKGRIVLHNVSYSLMHGRIKGPRPLVNPIQSDKTFITWVIKILHGNGAPKATNLRLATRMSLPAATICSALTAAVYKIS